MDIDRKIEEQQQTLNNVNDELKKLDTVIESIGKHLGDMSSHPTYGKYAYFKLGEIQKFMLDQDDDDKKNQS